MPTPNDAIEFFRSLGVEPIVIDPNDKGSVEQGLNAITERVLEYKEETAAHDRTATNNQQQGS
ncbi:hypothetical protein NIES4101_46110 [Calothrix sp. NIES-4101]|nr:hypothetical protein NIES4101_46110 [Calothrix sp. NIES-4101]